MKTLLLLIAITMGQTFAAELSEPNDSYIPGQSSYYLVKLLPAEKVKIGVGQEITYSCWKNFDYEVLKNETATTFVVLKEMLFHPAVVCNFPVKQIEGTTITLENTDFSFTKYVKIHVPEGERVELLKIAL